MASENSDLYEVIKEEFKKFKEVNFPDYEFDAKFHADGYPPKIHLSISLKSDDDFDEEIIYKYTALFEDWIRERDWKHKILPFISAIQFPGEHSDIIFGISLKDIKVYYDLIYN